MNRFMFFLISLGILWLMAVVSCFGSLAMFGVLESVFKIHSDMGIVVPLGIGFIFWIWASVKLIRLLRRRTSAAATAKGE